MPVIYQDGTTRLRDYGIGAPDSPPVLVIPSLINRYSILDLDTPQSFLRQLACQGFHPYIIDWDEPGIDEAPFAVADYINKRLIPMLERIASPKRPAHLVGYCMGGNLALALASLRPSLTHSLTLIATPWDFHQPDPERGRQFQTFATSAKDLMTAQGGLPVDIIQSFFAGMQPLSTPLKFMRFAAMNIDSQEAHRFVLVEDWLNDGIPLTVGVAQECLVDWYGDNLPIRNRWRVDNHVIDPTLIECPAYILVPGRDRIVPPQSALPLSRLLPRATLHEPMTGHVGLMAGHAAPQQVWAPWFHWLKHHA